MVPHDQILGMMDMCQSRGQTPDDSIKLCLHRRRGYIVCQSYEPWQSRTMFPKSPLMNEARYLRSCRTHLPSLPGSFVVTRRLYVRV